jgi:exodeoxyribonuclease VII small subunit
MKWMAEGLFGMEEEQEMPKSGTPQQGLAAEPGPQRQELRFEEAYARLEELVEEMERGELPLEDLLCRFEEGVKLVRFCQSFLQQAQLRVERFVEQKNGHWVLKELSEE